MVLKGNLYVLRYVSCNGLCLLHTFKLPFIHLLQHLVGKTTRANGKCEEMEEKIGSCKMLISFEKTETIRVKDHQRLKIAKKCACRPYINYFDCNARRQQKAPEK